MESYKKITLESYNKNAKTYANKFKSLINLEKRHEFKKFIDLLPGKRILDVGCGGGNHALIFSQQGFDIMCIDFSEEMIKLCKEKGLNAQIMDIENLSFPENSFDGVWAVCSLLHVPKKTFSLVIKKIQKILVPEGIVYICVKEGKGEMLIKDKINTERFFCFWEEDELADILKKYFEVIDVKKIKLNETICLQIFLKNSKISKK